MTHIFMSGVLLYLHDLWLFVQSLMHYLLADFLFVHISLMWKVLCIHVAFIG